MALVDDLEGILGAEAIAKLPADVRSRIQFGDELTDYYNGAVSEEPKPPVVQQHPRAAVAPPAQQSNNLGAGLDDIGKLLDSRISGLKDEIAKTVNETIEKRGGELTGTAIAVSLRNTRDLLRIENRYEKDFGETFDDNKLNEFVNQQAEKGVKYASITDAYEAWTAPRYTEKKIEEGVREGLKQQQSGQHLPGVSPQASRGPVAILQSRRANDGGGGGETAVSRAGRALQERLNATQNA